jgi:hypothetical protein
VGAFAAGLIKPAETIVIDAGPTAYAVAQAIPDDFAGCVITHSMPVLQLLDERTTAARMVRSAASSSPTGTPSSGRLRRPWSPVCGHGRSSSRPPPSTPVGCTHRRPPKPASNAGCRVAAASRRLDCDRNLLDPSPASADDPGAGDPAGPRPNLIVGVAP